MCTSYVSHNRQRTLPCTHYPFFFLMAPNSVLRKAEKRNLYYLEQWQHARGQTHASACGDCGANNGKGGSFFSEYSTFPCRRTSVKAPYSPSSSKLLLTWQNGRGLEDFQQKQRERKVQSTTLITPRNGLCRYKRALFLWRNIMLWLTVRN